ncbi:MULTISPECIES: topoisomerase DNA-binding C4 zinc finger domain-containing protein [unclassified Variovorax]|uniref:topoisomerase DNA-binding C4 zinc finger domain-containing protein n=1 Tax=unclassified Variovorax TaxID=663243 RepID=UPI003F511F08
MLFELIRSARGAGLDERSWSAEAKPQPEATDTSSASATPVCPRCAGHMVRRTARKGAHVGESFGGCAGFPKCRGTA